jgi:hypothetical protein
MVESKLASFLYLQTQPKFDRWKYPGNLTGSKKSGFEKMVKNQKLMVIIILLPYLTQKELARFYRLNKSC